MDDLMNEGWRNLKQDLDREMPVKNDRRPLFFMLFLSLIIMTAVSYYLYNRIVDTDTSVRVDKYAASESKTTMNNKSIALNPLISDSVTHEKNSATHITQNEVSGNKSDESKIRKKSDVEEQDFSTETTVSVSEENEDRININGIARINIKGETKAHLRKQNNVTSDKKLASIPGIQKTEQKEINILNHKQKGRNNGKPIQSGYNRGLQQLSARPPSPLNTDIAILEMDLIKTDQGNFPQMYLDLGYAEQPRVRPMNIYADFGVGFAMLKAFNLRIFTGITYTEMLLYRQSTVESTSLFDRDVKYKNKKLGVNLGTGFDALFCDRWSGSINYTFTLYPTTNGSNNKYADMTTGNNSNNSTAEEQLRANKAYNESIQNVHNIGIGLEYRWSQSIGTAVNLQYMVNTKRDNPMTIGIIGRYYFLR